MNFETYFSPDYATARERFRAAARAAGAELDVLALEARGPGDEQLTIDIARLGEREPRRVLLHSSGLHGVEAFAGSAVQLAALAGGPAPPRDSALVLVHVLNPYGMAWLRRANEGNVDLNRNFPAHGEPWAGAPALYPALDPLLNPASPPQADRFRLRIGAAALRHGVRAITQAIAEGQYEFPRGLFFGGKSFEPGPRRYLDWLQRRLPPSAYLFAIDLHTGLGRRGAETLILEAGAGATPVGDLARALKRSLVEPGAERAAYRVRGSMGNALAAGLPQARIDFVLQEIGTCPPLAVLHALREENRWHHYGDGGVAHASKQALREALGPSAAAWRRRAVGHGLSLLRAAAAWTFRQKS